MTDAPPNSRPAPAAWTESRGFSVQSVCWGYREIFRNTIAELLRTGAIGPRKAEVTRRFYDLLKRADQSCFDHVLKEFLGAINHRTRWIFDLPAIFADVTELGCALAEQHLHYGILFFRLLGEGGLGDSPQQVRNAALQARRLLGLDAELAMAFLKGYAALIARLAPGEVQVFVEQGVRIFRTHRTRGLRFLQCAGGGAENVIRSITQECRLEDVEGSLSRLLAALTGRPIEIDRLDRLDSDALIEQGSSVACFDRRLFLPGTVRLFPTARENRAWYVLLAVVSAGTLAENGFSRIHGRRCRTCADLVGREPACINLLLLLEWMRVLHRIRLRWPGARQLLQIGIESEFADARRHGAQAGILHAALEPPVHGEPAALAHLRNLAERSGGVLETAACLNARNLGLLVRACPALRDAVIAPLRFAPDPLYPAESSHPPVEALAADRRDVSHRPRDGEKPETAARRQPIGERQPGDAGAQGNEVCFLYPEWSQPDGDYLPRHCRLFERADRIGGEGPAVADLGADARRVQRVFERLKPDLQQKEKRLAEGDDICTERLVHYVVRRRLEPSPRVDFYEKPRIRKRDPAVLILLDVSGSTAEDSGSLRIIDLEKRAAWILGQGLHALGDAFSLCGFSGNGRRHCEYRVFKDFEEPWDTAAWRRLFAAQPSNATRIGAALRHSAVRLARQPNRQRLILLVTDGKPTDADYDPHTRYAQFDVRRACEENERAGIRTFGISTADESRSDMAIMFPHRRFCILPNIRALPGLLPRLYIHLTG